jgi:hypothetical protein
MGFPVIPRHSTTLMLAVRTQLTNQQSVPVGYKLLMLQRSSKMKFMVRAMALYCICACISDYLADNLI